MTPLLMTSCLASLFPGLFPWVSCSQHFRFKQEVSLK